MLDHAKEVLFLGVFADFDLDSGASIAGTTKVFALNPIDSLKTEELPHRDLNANGATENTNNDSVAVPTGETPQGHNNSDMFASVVASISYTDGTPSFSGIFIVTQAQDGSVFVVPQEAQFITADQVLSNNALNTAPIKSFQVLSVGQLADQDGKTVSNAPVDILCFTKGTMILTSTGEKTVEQLEAGDLIATKDYGMRELRWVGSTTVSATGDFAPVMIQKGAMGNAQSLRVSPKHRMLVQGWKTELLFGEREVLATAKHLVNNDTIYISESDEVTYYHLLLDAHQIIFANGSPSESFHPDKIGLEALSWENREEFFSLFPELHEDLDSYGPIARTNLKRYEAAILADNPGFLTYWT